MKTLIGITSYGGINFLKLALRGIRETLTRQADILVVIGKPGDTEMQMYLSSEKIEFIQNHTNIGFAGSLNDIFECAWVKNGYDNVIIQGNDVIPYPGALDAMIDCAEKSEWEWICSSQVDSRSLVAAYPQVASYFQGASMHFSDFSARPWEVHAVNPQYGEEPDALKDVRNLALFKRSVFEKMGYCDTNFWPNAYFEDNDAVTRALRIGIRAVGLPHSAYFHMWSRTIHQGEGRPNGTYFERNKAYYIQKWGGLPTQERFTVPFNGQPYPLTPSINLPSNLKIESRDQEPQIIQYWSSL